MIHGNICTDVARRFKDGEVTGLWEVRSHVTTGIARVIFTVDGHTMVLLHGFQKKSQRTPPADLMTAKRRLAQLRSE